MAEKPPSNDATAKKPEPPEPAPWHKYEYSPLDLAVALFVIAFLIYVAKNYAWP